MFSPPCAEAPPLAWNPAGPGPDPKVLLEARMRLNGTALRLLAFRVPMPYTAGWSRSPYWEDDKALHGDGLLWDVAAFKDFVRRVDEAPDDLREPVTIESAGIALDQDMADLLARWYAIGQFLDWSGQDWRPALIGGEPYIVLGYPEGPAPDDMPGCDLSIADSRDWYGRPPHQHSFNISIHGAAVGFAAAEVRAMRLADRVVVRPLHPEAAGWLDQVDRVVELLPGAGQHVPVTVGGKTMCGFLVPVDVETWNLDWQTFVAEMTAGLECGRMRWSLESPAGQVGQDVAAVLEGLAAAVRARRVASLAGEVAIVSRLEELPALLGLPEPPADTVELRALIYARAGRVTLRGMGRKDDDGAALTIGRALNKVFILPDAAYLCLSMPFVHLADMLEDGLLNRAAEGGVGFETALPADFTAAPSWLGDCPVIVDKPIRDLVEEIGRMFSD